MNATLLTFFHATDEAERERLLSELICEQAAPLIRHTIRQRLGFVVQPARGISSSPAAEDLYQDVIACLTQHLRELQVDPQKEVIRDFRQYVARVTINACHDYLREQSPARARLKNSLRELLARHRDFIIWRNETQAQLCGFVWWRGLNKSAAAMSRLQKIVERPEQFKMTVFARHSLQDVSLTSIVAEVFKWIDGPIELEGLVEVVAVLQEIKDQPIESLDHDEQYWREHLIDNRYRCESRLEARESLHQLWREVLRLPQKLRDTFCLSFANESGDDLFSLLIDAEIATLSEIATALGWPLERLRRLWVMMPLEPEALATECGATRTQVNKWRYRAVKQLEKQMSASLTRK